MKCKMRKELDLRRGTAIFLLLLMGWGYAGPAVGLQAFAADTVSAAISYTKKIKYESYQTHDYTVTVDGEKLIAYCVEPTKKTPSKATFNAERYNNNLVRKVLYYSYGYPGYSERMVGLLNTVTRKSCYKGTTGNYNLCHILLSYAYDNKNSKTDAFHGMSKSSKDMAKRVFAIVEKWPDPPAAGELSLSPSSVTAEYNEESGLQETQQITLNADADNTIVVEIPEETVLVKTFADGKTEEFDSEDYESVTLAGGESFVLKAPRGKDGTYTSPEMIETDGSFQPYIIRKDVKQNIIFAPDVGRTVSFDVTWAPSEEPTEPAGETDKEEPTTEAATEPSSSEEPSSEPVTTQPQTGPATEPETTSQPTEEQTTKPEPMDQSSEEPTRKPEPTTDVTTEPCGQIETTTHPPAETQKSQAVSKEDSDSSPMTGDEKHMLLAFVLMAASILAIGCTLVFRKTLL